jgi:hypothetical protein
MLIAICTTTDIHDAETKKKRFHLNQLCFLLLFYTENIVKLAGRTCGYSKRKRTEEPRGRH